MKKITTIIYVMLCALLAFLPSCAEKESPVEVSSVSLNTATIEMVEGETFSLVATVLPKDAEYDGVNWTSSNTSVASVNSGTVTALKEGTATITASAGGKSSACSVKVSAKVIPVTSITLDKISLSMRVGDTETLTATVSPADATDKTVTWKSSDESVAKVSDGKVSAIKDGVARIEVTTSGFSAYCDVTVLSPNNVIYYTAKYQNRKVEPFNKDAFGANIVSNECSDCNGKIVFDAPVTTIGVNAFYNEYNLVTIKLPSTVTTIGENAFKWASNLTAINIPEGVTFIGKSAFASCYKLTSIDLPPLITSIEDDTFSGAALSSIVLPKNVTKIGDGAFQYTGIQTIDFPNGLQSIGQGAFYS